MLIMGKIDSKNLLVIKSFRFTGSPNVYKKGQIVSISDRTRVENAVKAGYVKYVDPIVKEDIYQYPRKMILLQDLPNTTYKKGKIIEIDPQYIPDMQELIDSGYAEWHDNTEKQVI